MLLFCVLLANFSAETEAVDEEIHVKIEQDSDNAMQVAELHVVLCVVAV